MATTLCGCHSSKHSPVSTSAIADTPTAEATITVPVAGSPQMALPCAVVYKMNGDYADCVPVTVSPDGNTIVSYPAPSDLTSESTPLPVADGYLLDRRGVNVNTRFLRLTYNQYRALPQAPSLDQIKADIIPDARVIDLHRLPISLNQALMDIPRVNQLIKELK